MARIRSIKPEFWTDTTMVALPFEVRLFFVGMWNHADDYGVLKDDPAELKMKILPADDVDALALVDQLVAKGRVLRCVAPDGTRVLVVRNFCLHQKIDKRAVGRWGHPDDFTDGPADSPPAPTEPADPPPIPTIPDPAGHEHSNQSPPIPTDPAPGTERNGTERSGEEHLPAPASTSLAFVGIAEPASPARKRDDLYDALVEVCGWQYAEMTKRQRSSTGVARAELAKVGATTDDVHARAAEYRRRFPQTTLTPNALCNQWAALNPRARPPTATAAPRLNASSQALVAVASRLAGLDREGAP